jgi:hypothetical protein
VGFELELVVFDTDEWLSVIHWRDPAAGTRRITGGRQLVRADDGEPRVATRLRAPATDDLTAGLNGPVFARG